MVVSYLNLISTYNSLIIKERHSLESNPQIEVIVPSQLEFIWISYFLKQINRKKLKCEVTSLLVDSICSYSENTDPKKYLVN